MALDFSFAFSLTALLLVSSCTWETACSQQRVDEDISMILNVSDFCVQVFVNRLNVTLTQEPSTVMLSWERVSASLPPGTQYEIVYRPLSTTTVQFSRVSNLDSTQTTISGLQDSATYEFYIRLVCTQNSGVGNLSSPFQLTLLPTLPEGMITGLNATVTGNIVMLRWNRLPEDQWNGVPLGYYIYFFRQRNDGNPYQFERVVYPQTNYTLGLLDGTYYFSVAAVNVGSTARERSVQIEVVVGNGVMNSGGNPDDVQVLDYPWVYILIPGLVCFVIIVVVTLVIFKKVHESRKRTVTYCRDIEEKMYNGGFNNVLPMNNLSSPVTSTSLSIPNSSPTACSVAPQPNPLATRPLPNSPLSDVSPTFVGESIQFGNGLPSNQRPEQKIPHPGGLPLLHEAAEPGFVQMHRTNTNQSVFSSGGASVPPQAHNVPRTRNRAQTVGGIPSPYEVPEQNGNTLPRSGDRPSTAHATHHGHVFQIGSAAIPPPPAHSPPPLTHSSMEIRARMGEDSVFSPPGQHTLPRSMGSSRSYSVTSHSTGSGAGGGAAGGGPMRHMKSDGHLPRMPVLETHEENVVYIQPPLDSSVEASIHSASSYGAGRAEVVNGERRSPPHHQHHHHHHPQGQLPQSMRQPNTVTYVADSEQFSSFSEMTSEPGSIQSGVPRMPVHHAPPYNRERSNQSRGRESVFSETSTELSISSASEKELSPTGWDHRGTTSEVGVGFRNGGTDSPIEREAYSDVGTPGQLPSHSHRVYKQV